MNPIRCGACGVRLSGVRKVCPLCGAPLNVAVEEDFASYPTVPLRVTHHFLNRLVTLCALAALAAVSLLLLWIPAIRSVYFPLCLGIAGAYVVLIVGMQRWRNVAKSVLSEAAIISGLCFAWDGITGWRGWSLDFVLPLACCGVVIFNFALCTVVRYSWAYGGYFLISLCWAVAVWIFLATGLITVPLPALLALTIAGVLTVLRLLMGARSFLSELSRRLHV